MRKQEEDFKAKEKRMAMTQERLSRKVADLEKVVAQLRNEADVLETQRLGLLSDRMMKIKTPKKSQGHDIVVQYPSIPKKMPLSELKTSKVAIAKHSPKPMERMTSVNNVRKSGVLTECDRSRDTLTKLAKEIGAHGPFEVIVSLSKGACGC